MILTIIITAIISSFVTLLAIAIVSSGKESDLEFENIVLKEKLAKIKREKERGESVGE